MKHIFSFRYYDLLVKVHYEIESRYYIVTVFSDFENIILSFLCQKKEFTVFKSIENSIFKTKEDIIDAYGQDDFCLNDLSVE